MKKFYLLALLCTGLSSSLFAKGVEINGIHYLLDSTNYTASVTYTSLTKNTYTGVIVIPSSADYNNHAYNVTGIGEWAFYNCSSLTSVTIPNSVTSIGKCTFYGCSSLTSVMIPNSVISIGEQAFRNCSGLTSIIVEFGNTAYDSRNNCNAIIETSSNTLIAGCKNTIIPNSVTSFGKSAFYGCSGLTSVTIPNGVTNIGDGAFASCSGLTSVTIPNSVTSIGESSFYRCSSLTSVTIPNSVTSFGYRAFNECTGLISVTISNGITSIGSGAFYGCTSLTSVTFPNSIKSIEWEAFVGCTSLTSVEIPDGVTSIGTNAFAGCSGLTSVTIPNGVTNIGDGAFASCNKLDTLICKANIPPALGTNSFNNISSTAVLLVPYESIDAYKAIAGYADYFAEIKGFSDVEDITDTTATLKWIPDSAVTQYDINVYTGGAHFAQYLVDGNGQIISSQHYAPSIYYHKLDTTVSSTEYFVISLDGLSAGTSYSYTIDGINAHNAPIYHEEGSFKTIDEGEEGLFDVILDDPRRQAIKIFSDGQIFILRGDKVYNVQGALVK